MTFFGTSAGYLHNSMKMGINPQDYDLSNLRAIGSTGSPLMEDAFRWLYENFDANVRLINSSGGQIYVPHLLPHHQSHRCMPVKYNVVRSGLMSIPLMKMEMHVSMKSVN